MKKKNYIRCWVVQNSDTGEIFGIEETREDARQKHYIANEYHAGKYEIIRAKIVADPLPKKVKPADCTRCNMLNPSDKECGASNTPDKCIARFENPFPLVRPPWTEEEIKEAKNIK